MTPPPLILHVDDDEDDLLVFKEALASADPGIKLFQVQRIHDAAQFIELVKQTDPCLIVIDLNMPGIGGKELLPLLKNDPTTNKLPVVAFTTSALPSDKDYCACFGVACVTKPLYFEQMIDSIKELVGYCANPASEKNVS
ncbi:MAG TPA: response regulator [Flavisolibacter sp.]|nr:response regulator [Flavisolibacter sp.]